VPKQIYKIQEFHGGINSNADPRDIAENESPEITDFAIDSIGRLKFAPYFGNTTGTNTAAILQNKGLFTMKSDVQLDGGSSNETFIVAYDDDNNTFDIKDSEGWDTDVINLDTQDPVFYIGDGNLRISDGGLTNATQWRGYIDSTQEKFDSLNADSGTIGWLTEDQSIKTPTAGICLISTPYTGSDNDGVNSSSSEYIGNVADGSAEDVVDFSAVNLRVGVQYFQLLGNVASGWSVLNSKATLSDDTTYHPLFEGNNVKATSNDSTETTVVVIEDSQSYSITDVNSFIVGFYITSAEHDDLSHVVVSHFTPSDAEYIDYEFSKTDIVPDCWNLLVCSASNFRSGDYALGDNLDEFKVTVVDTNASSDAPTFWLSGPVIAKNPGVNGFQPGLYEFYHTYLYDEQKQESLPFKFSDTGSGNVNKINVLGSSVLFNFDSYINPWSSRQMTTGAGIDVSANTIVKTSHGLKNNDVVKLEGKKNSTGWNEKTLYYVVNKTANTFQIADSKGGSAKTFSGADETLISGRATGGSNNTITLASGSSSDPDAYNGYVIYIASGGGSGQYRVISDYNGSTLVATVDTNWVVNAGSSSDYQAGVSFDYYGMNRRVRGTRLYYKVQENDNYYLIGEIDFVDKGFKWLPEGNVIAYNMANSSHASTVGEVFTRYASVVKGITPSSSNGIDTFRTINGFSGITESITAFFKTAVIHGRRAYIGNVKQNGRTYPDRILKSQVNKFDVFPDKMGSVDVAVNDGESIVKLEAYADRILQFKEQSLYIINVSENVDFLEDTFQGKGIAYNYHSVKTDYGIAWFNKFGVYFYDGNQVVNLLEKGGIKLINEVDFYTHLKGSFTSGTYGDYNNGTQIDCTSIPSATFVKIQVGLNVSGSGIPSNTTVTSIVDSDSFSISSTTTGGAKSDEDLTFQDLKTQYCHIAYIPNKRQILITNNIGDALFYDFTLSAWTKKQGFVETTDSVHSKTNFALDENQDLFYLCGTNSDIKTFFNDSDGTDTFSYKTRDIDFGEPGVQKKVYKVYISFKGAGSAIGVTYGWNGESPSDSNVFYQIGSDGKSLKTLNSSDNKACLNVNAGTTDWLTAELRPSTPSNLKGIYSFQIKISPISGSSGGNDFEINDITVVYRMRRIK
tara:strand:+ start:1333 stop:4731 length:3399 start_codon:yes stop_codon:yes gene_type:complete